MNSEFKMVNGELGPSRSAPHGVLFQECHPKEPPDVMPLQNNIELGFEKVKVLVDRRLSETAMKSNSNTTRDAPGTARSTWRVR